jgi:hypothetical protein
MRRILIVSLLFAATSAYADHIWRLWCGNPPPPRKGTYDNSAECHKDIETEMGVYANHCTDTKHGMVWKENRSHMVGDFPNCSAGHDYWSKCSCEAEAIETK